MLDFIKNNKKVFGLIFLAILLLLVIFGVMLFMGGKNGDTGDETPPAFPDTTTDRDTGLTDADVFGPTDAARWVGNDENQTQTAPRFRAITEIPVAGMVTFEENSEGTQKPFVRYVALNNGHIYQAPLTVVGVEDKLSIENIHRIGAVEWSSNGSALLTRYFGDDKNTTIHARLGVFHKGTTTDTQYTLEGRQLDEQIITAAFSPNGTEVFYLVESPGGTIGYIESVNGGTRTQVWESVFRNLTVSWETPSTILIYKNPSSVSEGIVWMLDANSYEYAPILGKELALAVKQSPDGKKLLYSMQESKNAVFSLRVLDIESGQVTVLPVEGMVDKCTWGAQQYVYCAIAKNSVSGDFLEGWYMGINHTNDMVWRIDVRNGNIKKLLDPEEEVGEPFDITNMEVTPSEDYLLFTSRVNKALWALELPKQEVEVEVPLVEE